MGEDGENKEKREKTPYFKDTYMIIAVSRNEMRSQVLALEYAVIVFQMPVNRI